MKILILLNFILVQTALGENILFLSTMASPSHHIWNKALILGLLEQGHNVTSLTHLSETTPIRNWTLLTIEGLYDVLPRKYNMKQLSDGSVFMAIPYLYNYPITVCEFDMQSRQLETLLNYPNDTFSMIVFDVTLGQCMYPLIEKFNNPPVVALYLLPLLKSRSFGSQIYTSHVPFYSSSFPDKMTLAERYVVQPAEFKIAQKRFGNNIRPLEEVEQNFSLVLTNIDHNLDYPMSLPPYIIPVGGLHIKPARPLPQELQTIFDDAEHGVVFVSFGTNIQVDTFGKKVMSDMMEAFGKLRQTVIWKFDGNSSVAFPKNVIPIKWLPQNDLLAQPNLKLFVSQCGGFSYQEAIYHGVPVVAIPFVIDQYTIAARLVERKLAVRQDHLDLTSEKLYGAITEVLENPIYRVNMKIASSRYRDQPQTPLERGLYWIEYVLRHGNADNLVPISRNMPPYKLENVDAVVVLCCIPILLYSVLVFIFTSVTFMFSLIARKDAYLFK